MGFVDRFKRRTRARRNSLGEDAKQIIMRTGPKMLEIIDAGRKGAATRSETIRRFINLGIECKEKGGLVYKTQYMEVPFEDMSIDEVQNKGVNVRMSQRMITDAQELFKAKATPSLRKAMWLGMWADTPGVKCGEQT